MVVKEGQAVRDEMKQAFASGDAERVVRTYLARLRRENLTMRRQK
jgi:hypothetical protein